VPPPPKIPPPSRRGPQDLVAQLAVLLALIALLHLFWPIGKSRVGEAACAAVMIVGWLAWCVARALQPRQRVMTWQKPRGIDTIRRK
jgi:hypothetical protein